MTKQDDSSAEDAIAVESCGQCGDAPFFLHHIRHRGLFSRLCTTCVLRTSPQSFCPTCFEIHDKIAVLSPDTTTTITCSKCYSNSHTVCIGPNPNKPYLCPLCITPKSPVFNSKNKVYDMKTAPPLRAAAKISRESMSKAAALGKAESEKKAKEAGSSKKQVKQAIEHLACIDEKSMNNSMGLGESGFGNVNKIVGNVGERNLFGDGNRMDRVDNSSAVLAAMNAVEMKEKQKQQGIGYVPVEARSKDGNNGSGVTFGRQLVPVVNAKPIAARGHHVQNNHPRKENGGSSQ